MSPEEKEESLARTHCASCHTFPDPQSLDKSTWDKYIFPQMAFRMGVDLNGLMNISQEDLPYMLPSLPANAMVTKEEFEAIRSYFLREAPDSLPSLQAFNPEPLQQFEVRPVRLSGTVGLPALTMIRADTVNGTIWVSNRRSDLLSYSFNGRIKDSIRLNSPASWMLFNNQQSPLILAMGIMDPNDQPKGEVLRLSGSAQQQVIDSLKRPVHFEEADFNLDGRQDMVICGFGNFTGELIVMENTGSNYIPHVVSFLPGARKVIVKDFNNDKRPDILALFTQGDEQISLLTNAGNFNFRINTLLRFSPVMGSSYFDIADFNGDGAWDILYTNGDNADYSTILKPYHGVHIYLNDGENQFKESWFHPMPGCSKAIAEDFDKDGDLDVAAISFFPDFVNNPERGFIYFSNEEGRYVPQTSTIASTGRWLLMDAFDIDGDRDRDLLLGALDFGDGIPRPLLQQWASTPVDILVLTNNQTK
jgi:hypothetical protein